MTGIAGNSNEKTEVQVSTLTYKVLGSCHMYPYIKKKAKGPENQNFSWTH